MVEHKEKRNVPSRLHPSIAVTRNSFQVSDVGFESFSNTASILCEERG